MVASILLAHQLDLSHQQIMKRIKASDITSGKSWHMGAITKRAVFSFLPKSEGNSLWLACYFHDTRCCIFIRESP